MKMIAALALVAALSGCANMPSTPIEPQAIVKLERIVAPIPRDLLEIPDPVPSIPLEILKSDDKVVAKWLLDSEERTIRLEAQIRQLRQLYIQQLRETRAQNVKEGVKPPSTAASAP